MWPYFVGKKKDFSILKCIFRLATLQDETEKNRQSPSEQKNTKYLLEKSESQEKEKRIINEDFSFLQSGRAVRLPPPLSGSLVTFLFPLHFQSVCRRRMNKRRIGNSINGEG